MRIKLGFNESYVLKNILEFCDKVVLRNIKEQINNNLHTVSIEKNEYTEIYDLLKIIESKCIDNPLIPTAHLKSLKRLIEQFTDFDLHNKVQLEFEQEKIEMQNRLMTFEVNPLQYYYVWQLLSRGNENTKRLEQIITFDKIKFEHEKFNSDFEFIQFLKQKSNHKIELTMNELEFDEVYSLLRWAESQSVINPVTTSEVLKDVTDVADYFYDISEEYETAHEPLNQVQNDNVKLIA